MGTEFTRQVTASLAEEVRMEKLTPDLKCEVPVARMSLSPNIVEGSQQARGVEGDRSSSDQGNQASRPSHATESIGEGEDCSWSWDSCPHVEGRIPPASCIVTHGKSSLESAIVS